MPQAFQRISATNAYHPVATNYVISYSRKKDQFRLPRYMQLVEAPAPSFFYYELDRDQAIRIRNLPDFVWADGAMRPNPGDNQPGFREKQETVIRFNFPVSAGHMALRMADSQWNAKKYYLDMLVSQAMTARTKNLWRGISSTPTGGWLGLDSASIWPSTNIADANTLNEGAGTWDNASADSADSSFMAIRKALLKAANIIFLNTNGVVKWNDLRLVLHPDAARAMANTGEIRDFYKYSGSETREAVEGPSNYNEEYGLPKKYAGIEIVVEDSMFLEDLPTASPTAMSAERQFIKGKTNAVILSRQGAIDAHAGPSFSTVQLWWYDMQLAVQTFDDPENMLTKFNVVDCYTPVAPALVSGFNITNIVPSGV